MPRRAVRPSASLLRAGPLAAAIALGCGIACAPPGPRDGGPAGDGPADAGIADAGPIAAVDAGPCSSGERWTQGETGSALMKPGARCLGCHGQRAGAPRLLVAGTVMGAADDVEDCLGVPGVEVLIEAPDGGVLLRMTTNAAGNFFAYRDGGPSIPLPFTARVRFEGRERRMIEPQTMLDCTNCHIGRPGAAAFARIVAP